VRKFIVLLASVLLAGVSFAQGVGPDAVLWGVASSDGITYPTGSALVAIDCSNVGTPCYTSICNPDYTSGSITAIANVGGSPNLVRATTSAAHGMAAGATVFISGSSVASYDATYIVSAVSDTTHFDFYHANSGTATATWQSIVCTAGSALYETEAADADGSRNIYVIPKTGTYGAGNATEAWSEDIDCTPAAGHTSITALNGALGHGSGLANIIGSTSGTKLPAITLSRCGIKGFTVRTGESGESGIIVPVGSVGSVNIDDSVILGTGVYSLLEASQKLIQVLAYDGHIEIHDTVIGGVCNSANAASASLSINDVSGGGTNPKFHYEGGMIGIEGIDGSSCAAHSAAAELIDTFPETSFHRVSLGCEGDASCIETNDDLVNASFSLISVNELIVDNNLGRFLSVVDVDSDGDGASTSTLYISGVSGLHKSLFSLADDYDEAFVHGTNLFGAIPWVGATTRGVIRICGEATTINNNTVYYGPDVSLIANTNGFNCDINAVGNITEATADAPAFTSQAVSVQGMTCRNEADANANISFTLRTAAGATVPSVACTITDGQRDCVADQFTTTDIAAGATVAIAAASAGNIADGNGFICDIEVAY
jgi:hypothetical protein